MYYDHGKVARSVVRERAILSISTSHSPKAAATHPNKVILSCNKLHRTHLMAFPQRVARKTDEY